MSYFFIQFSYPIKKFQLISAFLKISRKTKSGLTALHLAAFHGYIVVARTLFMSGANIAEVDRIGRTPLHMATQSASSNRLIF